MPERLSAALRESMHGEVIPVARSLAEVRGLSGQTIRRLDRLQTDLDAERRARIEDLVAPRRPGQLRLASGGASASTASSGPSTVSSARSTSGRAASLQRLPA